MNTKVFTAHVPVELADQVDRLSKRLQRSRGWVVKQALEAWVARQEDGMTGFAEKSIGFDFAAKADDRAAQAVRSLKSLRETTTLGEVNWQELRDAGRR